MYAWNFWCVDYFCIWVGKKIKPAVTKIRLRKAAQARQEQRLRWFREIKVLECHTLWNVWVCDGGCEAWREQGRACLAHTCTGDTYMSCCREESYCCTALHHRWTFTHISTSIYLLQWTSRPWIWLINLTHTLLYYYSILPVRNLNVVVTICHNV